MRPAFAGGSIVLAMSSADFVPDKAGVLFFSRGRGYGHAIPDIEIARALMALRGDIDLRMVSYASGAKAIANAGLPLIELELPELNPITLTTVLAAKLIGWLRPTLVIAHEEFPAMPAAKIFDVPAVFLTDWFIEPDTYPMHALQFADAVFFLDDEGIYKEPAFLKGRVEYLGRFQRDFAYTRQDRPKARRELGIAEDAFVVSVLPGRFNTEARAPIADPVLQAFDQLSLPAKHLIWVAGDDAPTLRARTANRPDITVLDFDPQIDRIMVAADVAITKATRKTTLELESLGIPQIALSSGVNHIDDHRATRVAGLRLLKTESLTPAGLARQIFTATQAQITTPSPCKHTTPESLARELAGVTKQARRNAETGPTASR
jgi:predicted glycosyltransferase